MISAVLFFTPQTASAAEFEVESNLINSKTRIDQSIASSVSQASIEIQGKGESANLRYSSIKSIDGYVMFVRKDGTFGVHETLTFTLPAGVDQIVSIDLSKSPAWGLSENSFKMVFVSKDPAPKFASITFSEEGVSSKIITGINHLLIPEPYTPSSYHRLKGYRIFNLPLAIIFFVILLIVTATQWKNRQRMIQILIIGILIYNARFSIDLIRITGDHLASWYRDGTYDEAGSLYLAADELEGAEQVALCADGSSYPLTLLRHIMYPTKVNDNNLTDSSHAILFSAFRSSFSDGFLKCRNFESRAEVIASLTDGALVLELKQ